MENTTDQDGERTKRRPGRPPKRAHGGGRPATKKTREREGSAQRGRGRPKAASIPAQATAAATPTLTGAPSPIPTPDPAPTDNYYAVRASAAPALTAITEQDETSNYNVSSNTNTLGAVLEQV